jgi:hypothetical protein
MDLVSRLSARLPPAATAWLRSVDTADPAASAQAFIEAPRRVGTSPIGPGPEGVDADLGWLLRGATVDELVRAAIFVGRLDRTPPSLALSVAMGWHDTGDSRERRAILRALMLAPQPPALTTLAVSACRTSVQPVFEAIACENPFPSVHFSESAFNQMVLKAFFVGIAVERIVGLDHRRNDELSRMASDYAAERRAAGRSVPKDLSRVLTKSLQVGTP